MTRIVKLLGLIALISAPLSLLSGCGRQCNGVFDCKSKEACYFGTCTPAENTHLSCTVDDDCGKTPAGQSRPYICLGGRCQLNNNFNGMLGSDAGVSDVALIDIGPPPDGGTPDVGPIDGGPDSGTMDAAMGPSDSGPDPCTLPTGTTTTGFHFVLGPGVPDWNGVYERCHNDAWSVGTNTKVAHWDGTTWTDVPAPGTHILYHAFSAAWNDTWVVGVGIILHWDGNAMTGMAIPLNPPPARWNSVWGASANDVYFGGDALAGATSPSVLHWDGATLSPVVLPAPRGGIADATEVVFGTKTGTVTTIFAAGGCGGACGRDAFAYQLQGGTWTELPTIPVGGMGWFEAAWGPAANDVWFGRANGGSGLHWTGAAWDSSIALAPTIDLWGTATNNIYGVNETRTGITLFDGVSWNAVTIPPPVAMWSGISGSTTMGTHVWLVGSAGNLRSGP